MKKIFYLILSFVFFTLPAMAGGAQKAAEAPDDSLLFKGFILVEAVLIASLYILWRRSRVRAGKASKERFKKNIIRLRSERIKTPINDKMGELRKSLHQSPDVRLTTDEELLTKQAKKLSISKGELMLAARLKMLGKAKK